MSHVFKDDEGNLILATSSAIPGVMIVPPGKTEADAEHITPEEFQALTSAADDDTIVLDPLAALEARLAAVEEQLQKTKQK